MKIPVRSLPYCEAVLPILCTSPVRQVQKLQGDEEDYDGDDYEDDYEDDDI